MKKILLTILSVFTLISCSNTEETLEPFTSITIDPVVIRKGNCTGMNALFPQQNTVISNSTDWNTYIIALDNYPQKIEDINIASSPDFTNFMYIAFFDVIHYEGIHEIGTSSIVENATNIVINVSHNTVAPNVQPITQPYHIIKIPKSPKPIIFQ